MTGKDLIVYILENNLLNEPIFGNGKFIGTMTVGELAAKNNVGKSTVKVWSELGKVETYDIPDGMLIPLTAYNERYTK